MSEERLQALEARVEALAKACSVNAAATVLVGEASSQATAATVAIGENMTGLTRLVDGSRQAQLAMAISTAFLLDAAGVIAISAFLSLIDLAISEAKDATYFSLLRQLREVLAEIEITKVAPRFRVIEGGLSDPID